MLARPDKERDLRNQIEVLQDEVAHLRQRIAKLTGEDRRRQAIRAFGLTPPEGAFLALLIQRGEASHEELEEAIYSRSMLAMLDDSKMCIRSHAKRLRQKIRAHGIDFTTVYGVGWRMSEEAASKARKIMAGFCASPRTPERNPMADVA